MGSERALRARLGESIAGSLGSPLRSSRALSGGDINEAYAITLEDGRRLFLKTNSEAPKPAAPRRLRPGRAQDEADRGEREAGPLSSVSPDLFEAEARGLAWLQEARALAIPEVIAFSNEPAWLALEWMEPGARQPGFDEALGRGLAALHAAGAPCFGLDHDNFIGSLPQRNASCPDWASFYRELRLEPLLSRASERGLMPPALRRRFDWLLDRLEARLGDPEPPARVHGDLWGGNLHVTAEGSPALIDPAVYGGHREMDLAMMRLFGGFSERCFAAYEARAPLQPEAASRVPLWQLYPLLVHLNLFGGGYLGALERALAAVL
ncbi:MAG: fructosamine kinase family protein [Myxococcales bacterium]|nr:fructosamine kinase family protein [Myxococcales bacterium]